MIEEKVSTVLSTVFALFLFLCGPPAQAGQYAAMLGEQDFYSGSDVIFTLVFLQQSPEEQPVFPDELVCQLTTGEAAARSVTARSLHGELFQTKATVRTYYEQRYSFGLPSDAQGQVIIKFPAINGPALVFHAQPRTYSDKVAAQETYPTLESLFDLYQPYAKNASAYEPMYFLVGTDPEKSKFQISFKYRFINSESALAQDFPWVSGLHFGYTQTSFWDLQSDSAPFDDTSYKPEMFWLSKNYLTSGSGMLKGLFFQGGMQHESNGRGGDFSRSTNYLYAKPIFVFYNKNNKVGFQISPKLWTYVDNDDTTNPDLMDYRGYFEIEAKAGLADSLVLGSTFGWAEEGASFQFDLSYPLHRFFNGALDVYFYAQYTNMLAEELLNYTERSESFRLGLAFVR